jgi:predicted MFS family arabinose efflux permease
MPSSRWLILAVLLAARAATGFQFQSVGSATHFLLHDFGFDYAQLGMLLGAYLLPGAVVALPAGLLGGRLQETRLALAGLALMIVSGVGLAYCDTFLEALAARCIGGVGATMVVLVATKLTTDWFEGRELVLAMSLLQMSWPFGAMLALPTQAFIAELWGWPAVMLSAAICAMAAFAAFAFIVRPTERSSTVVTERARLPASFLRPVIVAGIAWGAMNLACILFFSYAPLLMSGRGVSPTLAASLTSLSIWLTILAIPSGGCLVDRLGRPIAAIVVCAPLAALMLLLFVADLHPATSCLVFGIAVGPLSGAILALPAKILAPRDRLVGFGIFYTCFYVIMAVGPLFAGHLQDAWESPAAALIAAAALLALVAPLALWFALISARRPIAGTGRSGFLFPQPPAKRPMPARP